jgi:hypothetical protein
MRFLTARPTVLQLILSFVRSLTRRDVAYINPYLCRPIFTVASFKETKDDATLVDFNMFIWATFGLVLDFLCLS